MERYLRDANAPVAARIGELRQQIERESGTVSRAVNHAVGRVLLWSARRECAAYPDGRPLEPRTFVDRRNWSQPVLDTPPTA